LTGRHPNTPFLFLPQVNNFPYFVTPALNDLPAPMSTKPTVLTNCGKEILLYDPSPSYPLRPKPHDQV